MPSISATSDTVILYGGSNRFNTASLRSSENRATTISQSATIWLNLEGVNYPARAGRQEIRSAGWGTSRCPGRPMGSAVDLDGAIAQQIADGGATICQVHALQYNLLCNRTATGMADRNDCISAIEVHAQVVADGRFTFTL